MYALGSRNEILPGVDDHIVGAGIARQVGFLVRAGGSDHVRSEHLRHLDQQKTNTARGRVHQASVAGLELIGGVGEVVRRHTLQHRSGRGVEIDSIGNLDELPGGHARILGVRTALHRVGDAVAGFHLGNIGCDSFHRAGAFVAEQDRRIGLVQAHTEIDVDEVDAAGGDLD